MRFIKNVTVSTVFVFLIGTGIAPFSAGDSLAVNEEQVIRIMSANITSGDHQAYEDEGIRIFQGLEPDIVLIQEFNYEDGTLRDLVDEAFGPEFHYCVEGGGESIPNGIVSRFRFLSHGEWEDPYVSDRDFVWAIIDIPGDIELQAVSVHLKASSGDAGTRYNQTAVLKNLIELNFNSEEYIVVGGDLNTSTYSESCLDLFDEFLSVFEHIPEDQDGNHNTSEPRTKHYDWVIPNDSFDSVHTDLIIESNIFENGLVFDSWVYTPLDEVYPIQYGDSHVQGMQHMAVMKAFQVNVSPTPSLTPTAFLSPTPFCTPVPSPSSPPSPPTATFVPSPTFIPSPTPNGPRVNLMLNDNHFKPYSLFRLRFSLINDIQPRTVLQFILLDVYGTIFFHPSWHTEAVWMQRTLTPNQSLSENILEFMWPPGSGNAENLCFHAGLTNERGTALVSNVSSVEFSYSDD